jgi:hypothetical protein
MKGLLPRCAYARSAISLSKPGTATNQLATSPETSRRILLILLAPPLRFVNCECLGTSRTHARAHKRVLCPAFFGALLAAVEHIGAAAAVPELASRGGRGSALPANFLICRALFGCGGRGLDSLGGHLTERGAKVVAHRVHAGGVVSRCCLERNDALHLWRGVSVFLS